MRSGFMRDAAPPSFRSCLISDPNATPESLLKK